MKKLMCLIMMAVLGGCSAKPSMKKADFELPENWQAGVTVTDVNNKTGRAVFFDENGETGSVSLDLPLADSEHPLPENRDSVWLVSGFDNKDFRPAKTLYQLSRNSAEAYVLTKEPAAFTAAGSQALYFAHTENGTGAKAVLEKLDTETMKKTSDKQEDGIVRGLAASENGVCLLTVRESTDLKASFFGDQLNLKLEVVLLDDTVGNIFYDNFNGKTAVIVQHMAGETPLRSLFILEPDTATVSCLELPFSPDGIPYFQDDDHVLIVEAMERNDVLITRFEISTGKLQEYTFAGSFNTMTADDSRIYLIDQNQTVHVLDGKNPSVQLNQFDIERRDTEYIKAAFSRN